MAERAAGIRSARNPVFFGVLVALNIQTSFLTPPMATACYYLKGVAPNT